MEFIIIGIAALFASLLTFFSGFGLGTMLLPVFVFFFPVDLAVALTAIVHLLNNLFKFGLTRKHINKSILLKFGIPGILGAIAGAILLLYISDMRPVHHYTMFMEEFTIMPLNLIIGILLIIFALFEFIPILQKLSLPRSMLSIGGLISGFFGGLSGHQGALRSTFLIRYGLSKEAFIATGVAIALFVDVARISVYTSKFYSPDITNELPYLAVAVLSAFMGAYIGSQALQKITIETIHVMVGVLLIVVGIGMAIGLI
ncbi:TSUP family transporter [Bacteroidota bacterium]